MKKAQAAMEYLMTYGWAILVVLIALGALFYLGVFSPRTSNVCNAVAPITCTDVLISGTTVTLALGATSTSSAKFTGVNLEQPSTISCTNVNLDISTTSPTSVSCTLANSVAADKKFSGTATATYILEGSDITHTITIQISGTAE